MGFQIHMLEFVKRYSKTISFLLGSITVLGLPPYHCIICSVFGIAAFFYLINGDFNRKSIFFISWSFGIGFFGFGLSWISEAFFTEGMNIEYLSPLPPIGLGVFLGLYICIPACLSLFFVPGLSRLVAFSAFWCITEILRGVLFTGFPWNPIGSVLAKWPVLIQTASVWGVYGVGFFFIMFSSSFGLLKLKGTYREKKFLVIPISILLFFVIFGWNRLKKVDSTLQINGIIVRLVQANIKQGVKWDKGHAERVLMDYIHLSRSSGAEKITHVLWPETATQFILDQDNFAHSMILSALLPSSILLAGSLRTERDENGKLKLFNSVVAVNDVGVNLGYYDKNHLVPFGEYVPLSKVFPFIRRLVPGSIDFSRGSGIKTTNIPRTLPVGILVCYEIIFPGNVVDKRERPYWIMNATNDAWYGMSAGPYQHFVSAQFRSVEEGIPVVRVANSGISGIIDAYGQVVKKTNLGEKAVLDSGIPYRTKKATIYGLYGNKIPLCMFFISILCLLVTQWRRK